jgi:hypothetical protein
MFKKIRPARPENGLPRSGGRNRWGKAERATRVREHDQGATCLREALRRRQGTQLADFFNIP